MRFYRFCLALAVLSVTVTAHAAIIGEGVLPEGDRYTIIAAEGGFSLLRTAVNEDGSISKEVVMTSETLAAEGSQQGGSVSWVVDQPVRSIWGKMTATGEEVFFGSGAALAFGCAGWSDSGEGEIGMCLFLPGAKKLLGLLTNNTVSSYGVVTKNFWSPVISSPNSDGVSGWIYMYADCDESPCVIGHVFEGTDTFRHNSAERKVKVLFINGESGWSIDHDDNERSENKKKPIINAIGRTVEFPVRNGAQRGRMFITVAKPNYGAWQTWDTAAMARQVLLEDGSFFRLP